MVGDLAGFILSQVAKGGESKRALAERRALGVEERRRGLADDAVNAAQAFLSGRANGRHWAPRAYAGALRQTALLTGGRGDRDAGEALYLTLMALNAKVAGFYIDGAPEPPKVVHYPPDDQSELWQPYVFELADICQEWIDERHEGAWLDSRLESFRQRLAADRPELTGQAPGRTLIEESQL